MCDELAIDTIENDGKLVSGNPAGGQRMPLRIELNTEVVGSLSWELPRRESEIVSKMPKKLQKEVKADMEDTMEKCISMILENLNSPKLNKVGFDPLQEAIRAGTAELQRRLID